MIVMISEEKGYSSPLEALADGCRENKHPVSGFLIYKKTLPDGRIFQQIYAPEEGTMGKPMIFPALKREGFHDDGC